MTALLRSDCDNNPDSNNYCNNITDVGLSEKAKRKQKVIKNLLHLESSKGRENNGKDSISSQKDHTNENNAQGSSSNRSNNIDNNNDNKNNDDSDSDNNNGNETLSNNLKCNHFFNTILIKIKAFRDSCCLGVKKLAKKYRKSIKQVMIKAKFSVCSLRASNMYNYFCKWYARKYKKELKNHKDCSSFA